MQNRDAVIALTRSEQGDTLYAATPVTEAKYLIRSCRIPHAEGAGTGERELVGALLCLRQSRVGLERGRVVRCGANLFERVGGADCLAEGERIGAGGDGKSLHLVSSPIQELHVIDIDRSWVVEPLLRAYRNGDPGWRELLSEDPALELGNEGIVDEDSASISLDAVEGFYRRRLARIAARRLESARMRGLDVDPRHVLLSNEELKAALDRASGEMEGVPRFRGKERDATAAGIDEMLATVLGADLPDPARVVIVAQGDLEASLADAPGPSMKLLDLDGSRGIRDRRTAGRIAEGLDRMLRAVKSWTDELAVLDAAA